VSKFVADRVPDAFGRMTLAEALAYNSALEWAASWVEGSVVPGQDAVTFAANMAMSIRANKETIDQENFFDAVRADLDMTPEQKAYWLAFEQELNEK
jgi:hypothetical protein